MKSQGMQENQQVVFMSDGGENVRRVQEYLHPHGNTEEALERLGDLLMELSLISAHSDAAEKVADGLTEFETYIRNNHT